MTTTAHHPGGREVTPLRVPVAPAAAARAKAVVAAVPVLRTTRLVLRAPCLSDFTAYADIVCTERGRFVGGPMTAEAAWDDFCRMTATWVLRGHGVWAVTRDDTLLGFVLIGCEPGDQAHELGFLFLAEAEGHGYALEASTAVRDYARDTLKLPELLSYTHHDNIRATRLCTRLGAVAAGTTEGFTCFRHWGALQ